ncbi:MAG TPA: hypothetical protein VEK78_02705 [Gemmatimonadales bacterium]|nr:hypothetical protein [Gemmatimonadales bacterium]
MNVHRLALTGLCVTIACSRQPPPASGPQGVTITATNYAFAVPDTIPAGLTTLRLVNQGTELHHASLIRLGEGKTAADFQAGLQAAMKEHTPPPPWMGFAGGPNAVAPGDTATAIQVLQAGSYLLICWIPSADGVPHVMKGMVHPVVVAGTAAAAAEPPADVRAKLTDYDFEFTPALTAGPHTIRVENAGPQGHEIVIGALSPGKTLQDFIAWEQGGEKGPLPASRWLGGVATLDSGAHALFRATFAPGQYLILCFWPDAKDGKPHLVHGMAKQITVS